MIQNDGTVRIPRMKWAQKLAQWKFLQVNAKKNVLLFVCAMLIGPIVAESNMMLTPYVVADAFQLYIAQVVKNAGIIGLMFIFYSSEKFFKFPLIGLFLSLALNKIILFDIGLYLLWGFSILWALAQGQKFVENGEMLFNKKVVQSG